MQSVKLRGLSPSVALYALAVAAQAAALSLIDSPPFAAFQHYRPWRQLSSASPIVLGVLVIQTATCVWLAFRTRADLVAGTRRVAPRFCLPLMLGVMVFSAAVPTQSIGRFAGEVVMSFAIAVIAGLNLLFVVMAIPPAAARSLQSTIASISAETGRLNRWIPWIAAAWVFLVTTGLARFVLDGVPHIDDDVCYLFQAKYMALGKLWLPRPPDPQSFGIAHLIVDGDKWYGKFFPGWPVLLTAGVLTGVPWIVNPLLAAASVLLMHRLLRRIYDVRTAHAVTLLVSASPWMLFLSASLMAHAASLFWTLLALVAIDCQRDRRVSWWALISGFSLGMVFLTRPFDAVLVGPVAGLWALGLGARRLSTPALAVTGGTAMIVAGLYFAYNSLLTGYPMLAPHQMWADTLFGPGVDAFGFGPNIGIPLWRNVDPLPGHGFADVVLNANKNFSLLNFDLFGWAAGSLVLACLMIQPGGLRRRDGLMVGIIVSVIVGHSFYWAPGGPDFGARYWYLLLIPLAVLTVRGVEMTTERLAATGVDHSVAAGRAFAWVALATLSALITIMPWRSTVKYHDYRDIGRDFQNVAEQRGIHHALIFVRSPRRSDYQAAFNFNMVPFANGDNVFVRDVGGAEHAEPVMRFFPGRAIWVVGRESNAEPTIHVIAGPLPAGTLPPGPEVPTADSLQAIIR